MPYKTMCGHLLYAVQDNMCGHMLYFVPDKMCGHLLYGPQDKTQMKENLNSKSTMWGFDVSRTVNMRAAVI